MGDAGAEDGELGVERTGSVFDSMTLGGSSSAAKIVFYEVSVLERLGEFPRSPDHAHDQTSLDDMNKAHIDNSLFIFCSHKWLRGWEGAEGYEDRPHPDTKDHDKIKLLLEAIRKIRTSLAPTMEYCYVWLDYGCINQDVAACLELTILDQIIGACDLMLTPIYDPNLGDWFNDICRTGLGNIFEKYGSEGWNGSEYSYLKSAWCRVEMMYAANIHVEYDPERRKKFHGGLGLAYEQKKRPHLLYGTNEQQNRTPPMILPSLSYTWFNTYTPSNGKLTYEVPDRQIIQTLITHIEPRLQEARERVGYTGERNAKGQKHGFGTELQEDG